MDVDILELQQQVDALGNRLVENFIQTVDMLSALLGAEERYYTGSHCRFIAEKSAEVARYLGHSESEIIEIKTAALLHDIGKVGFPDAILSKFPTEMTSEEYRFYARHPELGRQILIRHNSFATIASIVHQHHERLDGSGFPQHLRGEEIHTGAFIIGAVDVYHNAMSKRTKDRYQAQEDTRLIGSVNGMLDATKTRYGQIMNHLHRKVDVLFPAAIINAFTAVIEADRRKLGDKIIKRLTVNQLKPGMMLADDYYTSYGMLIAARDEIISEKMIASLIRFAELGEVPQKLLVVD